MDWFINAKEQRIYTPHQGQAPAEGQQLQQNGPEQRTTERQGRTRIRTDHGRDVRQSSARHAGHETSTKRRIGNTMGELPIRHAWNLLPIQPNTKEPTLGDFVKGVDVKRSRRAIEGQPMTTPPTPSGGGKLMKEALQLTRDENALERARRELCKGFASSSSRRAKRSQEARSPTTSILSS